MNNISPMRGKNESFDAYKERQKNVRAWTKNKKKGTLEWISAIIRPIQAINRFTGQPAFDRLGNPVTINTKRVYQGTFRNLDGISDRKREIVEKKNRKLHKRVLNGLKPTTHGKI